MKYLSAHSLAILSISVLPLWGANPAGADMLPDLFKKFKTDYQAADRSVKAAKKADRSVKAAKKTEHDNEENTLKKLENAKRQANVDIKRITDTLADLKKQDQQNRSDDIKEMKAEKAKLAKEVKRLEAIIKDLAGRTYRIKDAWMKTTVKADFVNYGDTLVVFDGTFANKEIKFPMQWNFQDTPGNIEKLGRALLSATYSTHGVSNLDLKFLKPKPWATLTCNGTNFRASVQGDIAKVDTPAVAWTVNAGDDGQRWVLDPDGTIATKIDNQQELVLDILLPPAKRNKKDAVIDSGTKLALNAKGGKLTQRWAIKKIKKDHVIVNQKTGFAVDCGEKPANGAPLTVTELAEVPTDGQRWLITEIKTKDR